MKKYQVKINNMELEIIQDDDGKFITPYLCIEDWGKFGTALKPAFEPIIMARKPIKTTVAENVMIYGVGGINIDECRVEGEPIQVNVSFKKEIQSEGWGTKRANTELQNQGRFPANIILGYLEDEYLLKENITKDEKKKVMEWLNENA